MCASLRTLEINLQGTKLDGIISPLYCFCGTTRSDTQEVRRCYIQIIWYHHHHHHHHFVVRAGWNVIIYKYNFFRQVFFIEERRTGTLELELELDWLLGTAAACCCVIFNYYCRTDRNHIILFRIGLLLLTMGNTAATAAAAPGAGVRAAPTHHEGREGPGGAHPCTG